MGLETCLMLLILGKEKETSLNIFHQLAVSDR